jgi:siroheme synthase-like protein
MADSNSQNLLEEEGDNESNGQNRLFPIFLKLEELCTLVVGGGNVGLEKLNAILQNSPKAHIKLVATEISDDIKKLANEYPRLTLIERPYEATDMDALDLVIVAVNDREISEQVCADAKQKGKLVNAADKPDLCDFYLSSVVKKGNLKIAISTNGKSPTIAKRIKEVLNETIPGEIDSLLDNMQNIRNKLSGDFSEKVRQLNEITKKLADNS